jgi:putative chitinase
VASLADAALLAHNPEGLAQCVYSNRLGNGNASTGDGWAFIGRGIAQLTGRADYLTAAVALGRPYNTQPELVGMPPDAALTAAWFFSVRGCNALADAADWNGITRAFNGNAMLQADRRAQLSVAGLGVFS